MGDEGLDSDNLVFSPTGRIFRGGALKKKVMARLINVLLCAIAHNACNLFEISCRMFST